MSCLDQTIFKNQTGKTFSCICKKNQMSPSKTTSHINSWYASICIPQSNVACEIYIIVYYIFVVYSTSNQENTVNQLLYPGFVEEIVDAIRLNDTNSRYAVRFVLVILH